MILRRFAALILSLALAATAVTAQSTPATPDAAIATVITRQLEAFKANDGAGAFAHASPFIQGMFNDANTFSRMVQQGYPQIYRSRTVKFLKLGMIDGRLVQTVLIEGTDGTSVTAAYEMLEVDGVWRVNGVSLIKGEDA
jgi:Domain of unknown function (DUF4864)